MSDSLSIEWLGERRYAEGLALQDEAVADRAAGRTLDRVLLLEHPAVVTLGRSTNPSNLRRTSEALRADGIDVFEAGRGGDVTYHAPGQLVGYPILDLAGLGRKDVHDHLRRIEAGLMEALESFGVPAKRVAGRTGVFVDRARSARRTGPDRKIASIGIGLRKWVTFHGFALNVTIDLRGFDAIVPCGLADVEMTSIAREFEIEGSISQANGQSSGADELDSAVRAAVGQAMIRRLGPSADQDPSSSSSI